MIISMTGHRPDKLGGLGLYDQSLIHATLRRG